jgi:chromate reductase
MSTSQKIAIIVGSLRKGSFSRQLAKTLSGLAPEGMEFHFVEIGDLPLYNPDLEDSVPAAWTRYRDGISASDAVLFVTAEYNRGVPGSVKNAIDVGSRPWGKAPLAGKPAAIISTSIGAIGGFGANQHLRQSLSHLNMPTLGQPEAFIGNTGSLFDEDGNLTNAGTKDFLGGFLKAFAAHIALNKKS